MSEQPTPVQSARPPAPWLDGDVEATAAYMREQADGLSEFSALSRRNVYRITFVSIIASAQGESRLTDAEKNKVTVTALAALELAYRQDGGQ